MALATTASTDRQPQQPQQLALEPLTSVSAVIRCCTATTGAIVSLPHIASLVSAYLDGATPERWSLERACEQRFGLRMLKRLAANEAAQEPTMDPFYRAYLASKALVAVIRRADDMEIAEWICCEYCPSVVPVKAIVEATSQGRFNVLQWLFERHPSVQLTPFLVLNASHPDVLQWLARNCDFGLCISSLVRQAATCGHLGLLKQLYEEDGYLRHTIDNCFADVIANGHFDVAKFLASAGYKPREAWRLQFVRCVESGDLEMVKWVHSQFPDLMNYARGWIDAAAASGHLHIVKWIHENITSDNVATASAMNEAARGGYLEIMQWLHANRTEGCTEWAMTWAAEFGHLDVVKWLHANRWEGCNHSVMDKAAKNGHFEIVKWLHANRKEVSGGAAMGFAAHNGHFEIVKWLHANRTDWSAHWTMNSAVNSGHLEMVQWLHENRVEGSMGFAMDHAAGNGHLEVVKWLHENRTEGCASAAMDDAAKNGHLEVVKWLHENRTEGCTTKAMDETNSMGVLEWLYNNRVEGCTHAATENAIEVGNFEKLLFLEQKNLIDFGDGSLVPQSSKPLVVALSNHHFEIFQWLRVRFPGFVDVGALEQEVDEYIMEVGGDTMDEDLWGMFVEFDVQQQLAAAL